MFTSLRELLRPHWSVVIFWAIDLPRSLDGAGQPVGQIAGGADPGPFDAIAELDPGADPEVVVAVAPAARLTATEVADRLARGSHCVSLRVDGQFATTCWISAGAEWLNELAGWFVPGPGDAYVWDCATQPVFRGRHLYPNLLAEILRRLEAEEFRRVWIATEWMNWRSAHGVTRAGFRPVGAVVALQVGRWRWQQLVANDAAPSAWTSALEEGLH